jgi:xylose isomerase
MKAARYASFTQPDGRRFETGGMGLAELRDMAASSPEPELESGKQERVENLLNDYMFS